MAEKYITEMYGGYKRTKIKTAKRRESVVPRRVYFDRMVRMTSPPSVLSTINKTFFFFFDIIGVALLSTIYDSSVDENELCVCV